MKRSLRLTFLTVALCLTGYPLLWMTLAAFRTDFQLLDAPFGWPEQWLTSNFSQVLGSGGFQTVSGNACLLLLTFLLAALACRCMLDLVILTFTRWHLLLVAVLLLGALLYHVLPQVRQGLCGAPGFANAYLNSVCITVISVTLTLLLAALAAYPLACGDFPGKRLVFLLFLLGMIIPIHVTLIPLNRLLGPHLLNLKGSLAALIGPYVGFALPLSILILKTAFQATPKDLLDAARLDGCNAWQTFRHVVLPLARPSLATLLIFNFLTAWNDFAFALTLADTRHPTLPLALHTFKGEHGSLDVPVICAALVVAVAPLLTVYLFAQKHIIRGLTAGALKE